MNTVFYILSAVVGAVLALGTYIFVRKILLKGQKEEIIKKAELEAESIKKEKIFQAKEKFLSRCLANAKVHNSNDFCNSSNIIYSIASTFNKLS